MVLLISPHNVVKKDYYVSNFTPNEVNKMLDKHVSIYSQGINVSLALKILQTEPFLLTFFGGVNGKHVKNHLHVNKIKFDSVHISKNSYEKINIIDEKLGTQTIINDYIMSVDEKIQNAYFNLVKDNIKRCNLMCFEDRVKDYFSFDVLKNMALEAAKEGIKTVVDVKSKLDLNELEMIKPYMVKINKKALNLFKQDANFDDIKNITNNLLECGTHYILFDLYDEGVYLFSKSGYSKVESVNVEITNDFYAESTDALLAGFLTGLSKGYEEEKTLKLAYASSLAVLKEGPIETLNRKQIFDLRKNTKYKRYGN
ncbi:MAG: PfkB family carbohydrate kinase [Clostridia bacterium]|nr:PfkB family carbohydrate kinase [Clostridia bacterium]